MLRKIVHDHNRESAVVSKGASVSVKVDEERRLANMRNHTATHCLNGVLHHMFAATHQSSSSVTDQQLVFDFATYGQQITKNEINEIDKRVQKLVQSGLPVAGNQLLAMDDITLLPGETYPSKGIHLIQIVGDGFVSKLRKIVHDHNRESAVVSKGASVSVKVDEERRLANMRNHTATHCLNGVLHHMFAATHQSSSSVTDQQLVFDFATYGQQITKNEINEIDKRVQKLVQSGLPVAGNQLLAMDDITLLPGETYPSKGIHLIQIVGDGFVSKYNKLSREIRTVARKIKEIDQSEPFRTDSSSSLLEKLYIMGLINTKWDLESCDTVTASSFCRRRLPVVMVRLRMAQTIKMATQLIQQGHVRVGTEVVKDPAFLVTRNLEDFVTWVDTSAIKKHIMEYNEMRDDFDMMD